MVKTKCDELQGLLQEYQKADQIHQIVKQIEPKKATLEELNQSLAGVCAQAELFRQKAIVSKRVVDELRPQLQKVKESAEQMQASFRADPLNLTKGRQLTTLKQRVEQLVIALQDAVESAWKEYAKRTCPVVDDEELKLFESTDWDLVHEIRTTYADATAARKRMPKSDAEFDNSLHWFERLREALNRLPNLTDCPAQVRQFIQEAGKPNGAGLSLLTPQIREWLIENGRDEQYRIYPRR